jgi:hypothetical protein
MLNPSNSSVAVNISASATSVSLLLLLLLFFARRSGESRAQNQNIRIAFALPLGLAWAFSLGAAPATEASMTKLIPEQVQQYHGHGYIVVKGMLSPEPIDLLARTAREDRVLDQHSCRKIHPLRR